MRIELAPAVPARPGLADAFRHSLILAQRNLVELPRNPLLVVFTAVQPVMFVILFTQVFGGAIRVPGIRYIDFLIPGIAVQTLAFSSMTTAVGLAEDLQKGIIDRFRSLPIAASAVLVGRVLSDIVRLTATLLILLAVAMLIGFRFHSGLGPALALIVVGVVFGTAFSWMGASTGLRVGNPEAAQAASFVWLFPLIFASSAFVPIFTMPGWLQAFAKVNPVTVVIDTLRALVLGGPVAGGLWRSLAWTAVITVVFAALAVRRYRRV